MYAVLCALSLALVPSAQVQSKSPAEKKAEAERKAAEEKQRIEELQQAAVERILNEQSGPTGQRLAPPMRPDTPPAQTATTVTVEVYTGGGYGSGGYWPGYGYGGYGGYWPAFGYGVGPVQPAFGYGVGPMQLARPVGANFPNRPMSIHPGVHNRR